MQHKVKTFQLGSEILFNLVMNATRLSTLSKAIILFIEPTLIITCTTNNQEALKHEIFSKHALPPPTPEHTDTQREKITLPHRKPAHFHQQVQYFHLVEQLPTASNYNILKS